MKINEEIKRFQKDIERAKEELAKVIVGQKQIIEGIIIAILSNGHVLLEGVPGLGKTLLIKSLGQIMDLKFSRIQFTPDLMPADILGTNIIMQGEDGRRFFEFQEGPIFAQIILADEINRATPKTQSALLEAMQEQKVTVAGVTRSLGTPFFVLATQNPLEMEGVYPLPEAQIDRFFFKLKIDYPDYEELQQIVDQTTTEKLPLLQKIIDGEELRQIQSLIRRMPLASHVLKYATRLTLGTHPDSKFATPQICRFVRYGASPRGAQTLVLAGKARAFIEKRFNVSFSDICEVALSSLRHRIRLNFEGEAEGIDIDKMIKDLIKITPEKDS